jgi:curved DNA-binding protein CbpA
MPGQTLYEILEVRQTASQVAIRAAWERLSAQWDPVRPYNTDAEARTRYAAIKDAYATLGNPQKRAAYDKKLNAVSKPSVSKPSGATSKFAIVFLVVLAIAGYSYTGKREHAQIDIAKAPAATEGELNEADSRAKTELAQLEQQRARQQSLKDARAREQREVDLARSAAKQHMDVKPRADAEHVATVRAPTRENTADARSDMTARHKDAQAPIIGLREQRERSDVLAMKLDTEFASGRKLVSAPVTQNVVKR